MTGTKFRRDGQKIKTNFIQSYEGQENCGMDDRLQRIEMTNTGSPKFNNAETDQNRDELPVRRTRCYKFEYTAGVNVYDLELNIVERNFSTCRVADVRLQTNTMWMGIGPRLLFSSNELISGTCISKNITFSKNLLEFKNILWL